MTPSFLGLCPATGRAGVIRGIHSRYTGVRVGLIEKAAAAEFLGMEFAMWLYWQSETKGGKMSLEGIEEFELWFESPISLVADYGEATHITLKGGTPLESVEARQAFRENKKIARSRMRINYRSQTFTLGFNALNFAVSGLKIPAPPNASGPDYVFLRLEIFEEFEAFFASIFSAYLTIRLDDKEWAKERGRIGEWVKAFQLA